MGRVEEIQKGLPSIPDVSCFAVYGSEGVFKSAVILGRHKWIQARPYPGHPLLKQAWLWLRMLRARELHHELYDLAQDPTEHHNLARRSELARPLASLLRQHFQQRRPSIPPPSAVPLDEAERARIEKELKDLGYM